MSEQPAITYALVHCARCGRRYAIPQARGWPTYYCDWVTLAPLYMSAESELRCPEPGCNGDIEVDACQAVRTEDGQWLRVDFRWSAKVVAVCN